MKKDVELGKKDEPTGSYQNLEEPTEYRPINWKRIFLTPKYIPWHILWIAITVITVIITIKHDEVVEILRPFSEKVRDIPAGWIIPIVILIVISFPPLFGHEIIGLLCGVVYGLWIGFALVAAGTFLGEIGTWFAFKKALRRKAEKLERTNLNYAALARVTREGGFWMVFIIRFSIVPSHFSTAVFSTCDVKFWHFAVATFLTLPKQIFIVYLGVLLVSQGDNNKIQTIVLVITFAITVVMGIYIWFKMKKARTVLLEEQAVRRANYSMERLRQTQSASSGESTIKPNHGGGSASGMWANTPATRQDMPLGYGASQPPIGVALSEPADITPAPARYNVVDSRPEYSRYDATDSIQRLNPYAQDPRQNMMPYHSTGQSQSSASPWRMEQKPYYQQPSVSDDVPYSRSGQAQTGREWV